jgi:hypothetical protein
MGLLQTLDPDAIGSGGAKWSPSYSGSD